MAIILKGKFIIPFAMSTVTLGSVPSVAISSLGTRQNEAIFSLGQTESTIILTFGVLQFSGGFFFKWPAWLLTEQTGLSVHWFCYDSCLPRALPFHINNRCYLGVDWTCWVLLVTDHCVKPYHLPLLPPLMLLLVPSLFCFLLSFVEVDYGGRL